MVVGIVSVRREDRTLMLDVNQQARSQCYSEWGENHLCWLKSLEKREIVDTLPGLDQKRSILLSFRRQLLREELKI